MLASFFFFSSRRRHTRFDCDWSSDVCSSDLPSPPDPGRIQNAATAVAELAIRRSICLGIHRNQQCHASPVTPGNSAHAEDRKSTRLNSSHSQISYAVFCLKKTQPDQADLHYT